MGLTEEKLWTLTPRKHRALVRQWQNARKFQLTLNASLLAMMHNTAGKTFKETVTADMFLPGYKKQPQSLEEKMAIVAGFMRREVLCPDCKQRVKRGVVHECTGSAIAS